MRFKQGGTAKPSPLRYGTEAFFIMTNGKWRMGNDESPSRPFPIIERRE